MSQRKSPLSKARKAKFKFIGIGGHQSSQNLKGQILERGEYAEVTLVLWHFSSGVTWSWGRIINPRKIYTQISRLTYKTTLIKAVLNQLKDGQVEKWNRTGSRIYIKSLDVIEDDSRKMWKIWLLLKYIHKASCIFTYRWILTPTSHHK